MKLKTTIENIKANPEDFGRVLCEALGWNYWNSGSGYRCNVPNVGEFENVNIQLKDILIAYNIIHEAEKAVIEKVGIDYAECLIQVLDYPKQNIYAFDSYCLDDLLRVATADAPIRLVALLLALGIDEIEVKG